MDPRAILLELLSGRTLNESAAELAFELLLTGGMDEGQMGAMLSIVQHRGASVDEVVGAARAMRRHATRVPIEPAADEVLLDTCGTGGAAKAFNISTAAALVVAGAKTGRKRVLVAKHGNRSRSGRGSAEVLAALGVNVDASPEMQARCLREAGVCFSFAIHHHPAMRHAAAVRRSLGFPTLFNLLGPLTNPAGAQRQLIGVYASEHVKRVAEALVRLGAKRAIVAHGDGMDELCTHGVTLLAHADATSVRMEEIDAVSLGVQRATPSALEARDVEDSARLVRASIGADASHAATHAAREIVALNAAAGLLAAEAVPNLAAGLAMARESVNTGGAIRALERLVSCSQAR
jgi:anthranilate phosphoribosyltransferase